MPFLRDSFLFSARNFLFLADRKTECSYLFAEFEICSVCVSHEPRFFNAQFAALVYNGIVNSDRNDVSNEHIVRAERNNVRHLAFKRERAIRKRGAGDRNGRRFAKSAFFEFIYILACYDTRFVGGADKF